MRTKQRPEARKLKAASFGTQTFREMAIADGVEPKMSGWALDLTAKELKFLLEYIVDMDARKAIVRAGLFEDNAKAYGAGLNMLKHPAVRDALAAFFIEEKDARVALRSRMIEELSALSFYDPGDYISIRKNTLMVTDSDQLTTHQMKALKRVKQVKGKSPCFEMEWHDKVKAMELLDRMTGGGPMNQTNIQNNMGITVQISADEAGVC